MSVSWEPLARLTAADRVVTGDAEAEAEPEPAPTTPADRALDPLRRRPLIVFVHADPDACDGKCDGACQRYFDADEEVFQKEKVCLGLRAFRPIWMTPEQAAAEPLLADVASGALPRLVFLDVARGATESLHGKGLSPRRVYSAMKKTASRFYRESLDGRVKKHLKLLAEHDKLAQELYRVEEQLSLTRDDRRAKKLEGRLDEIKDEQRDLERKAEDLWDLTLKGL